MLLLSTLFSLATPTALATQPADTLKTYAVQAITVSRPIKHNGYFENEPVSVSVFTKEFMKTNRIAETKDLSLVVPNFIQPDYGAKMTSSIYVRGIGARMDQPSVGLYIDDIPVLNKNNYDIDYYDVSELYLLRGPQGTLYGRNTIGGVIDMHTLSPLSYKGTRINAGYGNGNTSEANVSTYHKLSEDLGISIALHHKYSDGFFTNRYDDTSADRILSEGGRLKIEYRFAPGWTMINTFFSDYVKQKGFAYAPFDEQTGQTGAIDHNDQCSYERFNIMDGLTFRYDDSRFSISSTTSYQYTDDDMMLDQDFTPASMFTLRQQQREHGVTQEFVLRTNGDSPWQSTSGLFGFYKGLKMEAPVTLKRDGIEELILDNANKGIQMMFPGEELLIEDSEIPIHSLFRTPVLGASIYHQSSYTIGRWKFTAGIRADYEHTSIKYGNSAALRYLFTLNMADYAELPIAMSGKKSESFFEFMPQASVSFDIRPGNIYVSLSRGYKSGGYNTQMFSDIMQNRLSSDLISKLGFPSHGGTLQTDITEIIAYKPEYSWNYEAGGHFGFLGGKLHIDAAVFYIDLRDQQLTVFPDGQTTGRMMSNAGRSRSIGAELTLAYKDRRFAITGNYGYTNAKFRDYMMEGKDYADNYVPHVPLHTLSLIAGYTLPIGGCLADNVTFNAGWQGAGKIYWNEANTAEQKFYGLLSASVTLNSGRFSCQVWSKNLTRTEYNTFYFTSMGNSFVQRGKPRQFGVSIDITL